MILKAKYENQNVLINSNYIVDVWDIDKPLVSAYILESERGEYKIEQSELQKWIDYENNPQEFKLIDKHISEKDKE